MPEDDSLAEQLGEFALWVLRWAATLLLVGIFAEMLMLGMH
ncbi:MAG: hypothetical protein JWO52_4044 [Gammaproteobacteria bacterium]|nr:hypothetical protein [Gammaproteobacteria bacterium]